jgi:hypothetical protein
MNAKILLVTAAMAGEYYPATEVNNRINSPSLLSSSGYDFLFFALCFVGAALIAAILLWLVNLWEKMWEKKYGPAKKILCERIKSTYGREPKYLPNWACVEVYQYLNNGIDFVVIFEPEESHEEVDWLNPDAGYYGGPACTYKTVVDKEQSIIIKPKYSV